MSAVSRTGRVVAGATALALLAALPASAAKLTPPTPEPRIIVLLRHGQYAPDPAIDPKLGPGMTPLGMAQARLAGARLAGLPFRFDAVLASPMTRAQQTARIVAADLPGGAKVETLAAIAECTPPSPRIAPGKDDSEEDMAACAARLDQVFAEHFKPALGQPRAELLVCHGNVIRYLVTKALHVDPKAWLEMSVGHVSLSTIRVFPDGTMQLIAAGDVGHLPPNLQTGANGDPERSLAAPGN